MKVKFFLVTVVFSTLLLAGCGGGRSINVYNWGDYINEEILAMFEKETGIRVNYDTFASNEAMYTKLKSGGASYDIAIPSDYMIEKMISEDMLEKIDWGNVPNAKNTHSRFRGLSHDPADEYSMPYMWGTLGILYNTAMVHEPVESWNILWAADYEGRIFMYNSQRDSLAVSLLRLGYSINTQNIDELNAAVRELTLQKPLVRAYAGDSIKDSMIGNEGALAVVYSGDAIYAIEDNSDLNYIVPIEGSNVFYDAIVIPKGVKNKSDAEKFIDFLCRPDIAAMNTEYIGYSTTNEAALPLIDPEMAENPIYWPDDDVFYRCEPFYDLGDFIKEYDRAWTEVLAG